MSKANQKKWMRNSKSTKEPLNGYFVERSQQFFPNSAHIKNKRFAVIPKVPRLLPKKTSEDNSRIKRNTAPRTPKITEVLQLSALRCLTCTFWERYSLREFFIAVYISSTLQRVQCPERNWFANETYYFKSNFGSGGGAGSFFSSRAVCWCRTQKMR